MNLNKNDLVMYFTGDIATVLKIYKEQDTNKIYIQAFTDSKIIYDLADNFKPMDCLLLRCNSCNKESYEIDLNVNEGNGMYICSCGSSTFTPLNLNLEEELGEY